MWYLLFVPAFLICFFALEAFIGPDREYWCVWCPLDDVIPFCEVFVIPYYLWYPFLFVTGLMLLRRDVPGFCRYMRFLIFGFGAALLFCLLVPNGQELRPESFVRDNALTRLVGLMYSMDTNTNVFPSMHVIGSAAGAAAICKSGRFKKLRPLWIVLALAISAATVFIKQHSVLDVLGGAAVSAVLYMVIYRK